jgi:hypothetical protein
MEIPKLDEIRKLGIIAMFSDDELMEMLVLKGGNAMALFYSKYSRPQNTCRCAQGQQ